MDLLGFDAVTGTLLASPRRWSFSISSMAAPSHQGYVFPTTSCPARGPHSMRLHRAVQPRESRKKMDRKDTARGYTGPIVISLQVVGDLDPVPSGQGSFGSTRLRLRSTRKSSRCMDCLLATRHKIRTAPLPSGEHN